MFVFPLLPPSYIKLTNPVAKAIEYMVVDALLTADQILDISGRIDDPERYLYLTDSILEEIECSPDPRLNPAKEIILRIRRRDLYRCVDYLHVGVSDKAALAEVVTAEKVAREANAIRLDIEGSEDGGGVREVRDSDVIIDWSYLHFGMRERDPIEQVLFYGKGSANSELFEYSLASKLALMCLCVGSQRHAKRTRRSIRSLFQRHLPSTHCECIREMGREPPFQCAICSVSDAFLRPCSLYGLVQNGFRVIQKRWQQQEPSPAQIPVSQASEIPSQSSLLFQTSNLSLSSVGAVDPKTPSQPYVQLPSTGVTGSGGSTHTPTAGPYPHNPYTTVAPNYRRDMAVGESPKSTATGPRKRPRGAQMLDVDSTLEGNMMKRVKRDP